MVLYMIKHIPSFMKHSPEYTGPRKIISIEVEEKVIDNFRVALAQKHRGKRQGVSYIEYNNALYCWTKVMKGEAEFIEKKPTGKAPVFEDEEKGRK